MSDTQKLTPALSTPERDLLRREIYKGLADRAAGRVKDLDVDAILAKGKELLQKRSISNVRQFAVDGRKTLLLLLLLFAIPRSPRTTAPRRHRRRQSTNMRSSACRRRS